MASFCFPTATGPALTLEWSGAGDWGRVGGWDGGELSPQPHLIPTQAHAQKGRRCIKEPRGQGACMAGDVLTRKDWPGWVGHGPLWGLGSQSSGQWGPAEGLHQAGG